MQARDGAAGSISGNHTTATAALFVNAALGDLHLKPTATALLNKIVTPLANAAVDWDGHARPAGGRISVPTNSWGPPRPALHRVCASSAEASIPPDSVRVGAHAGKIVKRQGQLRRGDV